MALGETRDGRMPIGRTVLERVQAGLGEGLAYAVALVGADLRFEWVSPSAELLIGYRPDELVGHEALALIHPDDVDGVTRLAVAELAEPNPFGPDPAALATNTFRVRAADGSYRALAMAANNQLANPLVEGFVLVFRDATAEHLALDVLRRLAAGEPIRTVVGTVADLLRAQVVGLSVAIDVDLAAGAAFTVARGRPPARPADHTATIDHLGRHSRVRAWLAEPTEPTLWCRMLVERAADTVRLALTRDVGAAELRRAARTDPLTGAQNRAGLDERLALLAAGSWGGLNTVLYVDLDDFKAVNDSLGHAAGDAALVECARRLRACLRADDVLARHGGDEFVAVCAGVPDAAVAQGIAQRIVAEMAAPLELPGGTVRCGASVGVAVGDRAATHVLVARADAALLRAKRAGKGRVELDER